MIEFPFRRFKLCFHFSFFAAVALLMLCGESKYALYGLYACLLHETGHLAVMLLCGQPVKKLVFYGAGIKIIQAENETLVKFSRELGILSAGCVVNFALYGLSRLVNWNDDITFFGVINLMVGLFNILPLNCLDGGKIIVLCFYKLFSYDKAVVMEKLLRGVNIAMVPIIAVVFFIADYGNFTLYVTLIYLLFTAILM